MEGSRKSPDAIIWSLETCSLSECDRFDRELCIKQDNRELMAGPLQW